MRDKDQHPRHGEIRPGKQGLHGEIYQLKLLMLFLKRGLTNGYSFRLSTEQKEAKKLDDLCFEMTVNGKKEYRLLQAKHKAEESKKVTIDNLLTESDGDYSLVKYFFSFKDSKKEPIFKKAKIHLTVCTNIGLDLDEKCSWEGRFKTMNELVEESKDYDCILDPGTEGLAKKPRRYRFNNQINCLLKPKLEHYNLTRLARRLAECLLNNNSIKHHDNNDIFKSYHLVLADEVIDTRNKKFHEKFIKDQDLSETARQFRAAFRDELKKKSLTLDSLNEAIDDKKEVIEGKSVGLNLSKKFGTSDEKERNWPDNTVSETDLNCFLNNLVFAVNQPNEKQLGNIIESDISKEFNFAAINHVYNKLLVEMLNWLNGKGEEFISDQDGLKFFEEIRQTLSGMELTGLTMEYLSKLEEFDVQFSESAIGAIEAKLLSSQVCCILAQRTTLSAIKVCQVLQKNKFHLEDRIFMRMDSILHVQDRVEKAFQGDIKLLVIECETEKEEEAQSLFDGLRKVIQVKVDKKIVLIAQENSRLLKKFGLNVTGYEEIKDLNNSLLDLTIETQDKLLTKGRFDFQGREVPSGVLIDEQLKHLVDAEVLFRIVTNEEIKIGDAVSNLGEVRHFYVDRTFSLQKLVTKEVLQEKASDLFAISHIEKRELSNLLSIKEDDKTVMKIRKFDEDDPDRSNPIRFIILDEEKSQDHFKHLCLVFPKHNIHWLKREEDDFVWQESQGTLSNVRKFLHRDKSKSERKESELSVGLDDKLIIISAKAGMGKSTALSSVALQMKESHPSLWIIRINLVDYSKDLKKMLNERDVLEFLYKVATLQSLKKEKKGVQSQKILNCITINHNRILLEGIRETLKGVNLLEIELFTKCYNEGRVVLLLDGFDEISPNYKQSVFNLLQVFKNTQTVRVWITTRPYGIQDELEDHLSVFSHSLNPFLEEQQREFLRKFWKTNLQVELEEQRLGIFINELLSSFSESTSDKEMEFVGIPLQIRMLAEIFEDVFKDFYASNQHSLSDSNKHKMSEKLNLVTLYEKFMEVKFHKIRFQEKKPNLNVDDPDIQELIQNEYEDFIDNHRILAMHEVFKGDGLHQVLSEEECAQVSTLLGKLKMAREKTGIIDRVVDDRPIFVHRTFAEYFASDYLWQKFKTIQLDKFKAFLSDAILGNAFAGEKLQTCKFFQSAARRDLHHCSEKERKVVSLLESLVELINLIYVDYDDYGKDCPRGTDDLYRLSSEQTKPPDYPQSIKLLFCVVEDFLIGQKDSHEAIENIVQTASRRKSKNLLRVSAEVGCLKFTQLFLNLKIYQSDYYRRGVKMTRWYLSPLWLAAKNQHLKVINCLRNAYDPKWVDEIEHSLIQHIFFEKEFNVLGSCLRSNIIDCQPYQQFSTQLIPIVEAFEAHAPTDVIKLLVEQTDCQIVNNFEYTFNRKVVHIMSKGLLHYDKEITELCIKKGYDFSEVVNTLLRALLYSSFDTPLSELRHFAHNESPLFPYHQSYNCLKIIEALLKNGVGYNCADSQHETTTLDYVKEIYYINQLLTEIRKSHYQTSDKVPTTILKLIIDVTSKSPGFRGCLVMATSSKMHVLKHRDKLIKYNMILHHARELFDTQDSADAILIESTLHELRSYVQETNQEIEQFKEDPSVSNYYQIVYHSDSHKTYLKKHGRPILERILLLFVRQDYEINVALEEVIEEILILKEALTKLKEKFNARNIYTPQEVSYILDLDNADASEDLMHLLSNIYECGGVDFIDDLWINLNYIGRKRMMQVIELMIELSSQSSQLYDLFTRLDDSYILLAAAIYNRNYEEIDEVLQNVDQDLKKAILNSQDDKYGSPLHYSTCIGDVEIVKMLLYHGANPDLRLKKSFRFHAEDSESWSRKEYEDYTPLQLAQMKGHSEIAQLLLKSGAKEIASPRRCLPP